MAKKRCRAKSRTKLHNLPPDLFFLILTRLKPTDRRSISLVSKSFQSLADSFVRKLTFKRLPSASQYPRLFARFTSVTQITFRTQWITRALTAIANSGLKIECLELRRMPMFPKWKRIPCLLSGRFGHVKSLKLRWVKNIDGFNVADFIGLFPSLEELYLKLRPGTDYWTDAGVENLALNYASCLWKISLDFNKLLTDKSLDALSNVVNLEHFSCSGCKNITVRGFCAFVRKSKSLKFLRVPLEYDNFSNDDTRALEAIFQCDRLYPIILPRTHINVFLSILEKKN